MPNPPPIIARKEFTAPSVFEPGNLLREARRQKNLPSTRCRRSASSTRTATSCALCARAGRARLSEGWACYHTDLYRFEHAGEAFGIIGCAVGAPFAVLLAEQLFASGCRFLVSMTSAGQIVPQGPPPYFILIDRALRDEGTSYHYLPPSDFAEAEDAIGRGGNARLRRRPPADLPRRELDDRRAVPRDRGGDRALPRP